MIYPFRMAVLQRIDNLAEDVAYEGISSEIEVLLCDHAEEVSFSKVHDEEDAILLFEYAMECDNAYRCESA